MPNVTRISDSTSEANYGINDYVRVTLSTCPRFKLQKEKDKHSPLLCLKLTLYFLPIPKNTLVDCYHLDFTLYLTYLYFLVYLI